MNSIVPKYEKETHFELFDIVYSEMCLSEKLARTYFHQILEAAEKLNVAVIEPSDLLLDKSFSLFISNQNNKTMVSSYIAPELLNDDEITDEQDMNKCVVFSLGVILFTLLVGEIPFEIAENNDKLYQLIINDQWNQFWLHFTGSMTLSNSAKELLWKMLQYEKHKRYSFSEIRETKWYKNDIFKSYRNYSEIIVELQNNFNIKESQRNNEFKYKVRNILKKNDKFIMNRVTEIFPFGELEGILDAYCYEVPLHEIYNGVSQIIQDVFHGRTHFDVYKQELMCMITTNRDKIKFKMKVFESKRWKRVYKDISVFWVKKCYKPLYVVRFKRLEGDCYEFIKIKNQCLLKCDVVNGLSIAQTDAFDKLYGKKIKVTSPHGQFDSYHLF
eukprot:195536_1